jgi:hypothetical protein
MTTATGAFKVSSWDEQPYEERDGPAKLTRAAVALAFTGDLECLAGQGGFEASQEATYTLDYDLGTLDDDLG